MADEKLTKEQIAKWFDVDPHFLDHGEIFEPPASCECGCGRIGPGGKIEFIHPEDYRDERG
jgi:hypothetical protein